MDGDVQFAAPFRRRCFGVAVDWHGLCISDGLCLACVSPNILWRQCHPFTKQSRIILSVIASSSSSRHRHEPYRECCWCCCFVELRSHFTRVALHIFTRVGTLLLSTPFSFLQTDKAIIYPRLASGGWREAMLHEAL